MASYVLVLRLSERFGCFSGYLGLIDFQTAVTAKGSHKQASREAKSYLCWTQRIVFVG